jgi:hypothetical protein
MSRSRSLRNWILALAFVLSGAGCGTTPRTGPWQDCFPAKASRWLSSESQTSEFSGQEDSRGPATIYVDSSGSMAGYVNGQSDTARVLNDLLATLPAQLSTRSTEVELKAFGSRIRSLTNVDRQRLASPAFFRCGGNVADCDNRDTRLDLVMREIEGRRDRLAVVITDMWFSDPASVTTGLVPLAEPLKNILADGRAIGVYGIRAPFDGMIYDLPSGESSQFSGDKPLMILVIGSNERVRRWGEQMRRSPSEFLARGFTDGSIRQAIFTLDPSLGVARSPEPLTTGTDRRVHRAQVLNAIQGVRVEQFRVNRSNAMRSSARPASLPQWEGPNDAAFVPHAVWRGPLATHLIVWRREYAQCRPGDWGAPSRRDFGWRIANGSGRVFALNPAEFVSQFRRPGTYLVTAEVARTSLNVPNEATAWLRDWSFSAGQPRELSDAAGRPLFRTLNLSEFSRLLEDSLAEAAERRPGPITGFTFVISVED